MNGLASATAVQISGIRQCRARRSRRSRQTATDVIWTRMDLCSPYRD